LSITDSTGQEGGPVKPVRLVVQTGHTSDVRSVAFSPDGRRVLTSDGDATRLWDAETGKELLTLNVGARSMAFSPDGSRILTGSDNTLPHRAKLWNANTGKELRSFEGHRGEIFMVSFSPDGKFFLTGCMQTTCVWETQSGKQLSSINRKYGKVFGAALSPDGKKVVTTGVTLQILDAKTGENLHFLRGHFNLVKAASYSPNGKQILTGGQGDHTARLWEADTGQLLRTYAHPDGVEAVAFGPQGGQFLTGSYDNTARLWETGGKELAVLKGHTDRVWAVAFSPDGKRLLTGSKDGTARLWEAPSGKLLRVFRGQGFARQPVAVSRDGTRIATGAVDASVRLWDTRTGSQSFVLKGHTNRVTGVAFGPDGTRLLTGGGEGTARLWDTVSGQELFTLKCPGGVHALAISRDGKRLLTASWDHATRVWDADTGKSLFTLRYPDNVSAIAFSADGKQVLTADTEKTAVLWDVESGKKLLTLKCPDRVATVAISPDGSRILTGLSFDRTHLWDARTGKELHTVFGGDAVAFSTDGKRFLTGASDHTTRVFDAQNGKEIRSIPNHLKTMTGASFTEDGKYLVTQDDLTRVWDIRNNKEVCRIVCFRGGGWAVIDDAGRYDASGAGDVEGLHWVVGLEPVALNQLKDQYYDPGLLAKHLGLNPEPLRNVKALQDLKLYPGLQVAQSDPKSPQFSIGLTNSGGGIGRVVVLVNGKEQSEDARPRDAAPNAAKMDIKVDLADDPRVVPGKKNKVVVLAYNADGSLSSRGVEREFDGPGEAPKVVEKPAIHAVIVGVSKYSGEKLNLRYAAKDAEDFATAFRLAASGLIDDPELLKKGMKSQVNLTLLNAAEGYGRPSRANIIKALESLKATRPGDIVMVYLAGHGVTHGGQDGDWYYLTADAQSGDVSDPGLRQQVTLSSKELTDLLKAAPAQKQVLILDTCHSGRVVEQLTEKRGVPGSQVRALERLKDRTGMHVLAGCAADSVSYEASRYGQGVLTYSLLMGMHGAKLRQGEYVDVVDLFSYAADMVPELAREIGGVQRPTVASPRGQAFDIGRLTVADQAKVPLQQVKPVLLRASFQDEKSVVDSLKLTRRVNDRLRERSAASGAKAVLVEGEGYPGAIQPVGKYLVAGEMVTVTVVLIAGEKEVAKLAIEGTTGQLDELADKIVNEIEKRAAEIGGKGEGRK
jgi:WD40 repeat protein